MQLAANSYLLCFDFTWFLWAYHLTLTVPSSYEITFPLILLLFDHEPLHFQSSTVHCTLPNTFLPMTSCFLLSWRYCARKLILRAQIQCKSLSQTVSQVQLLSLQEPSYFSPLIHTRRPVICDFNLFLTWIKTTIKIGEYNFPNNIGNVWTRSLELNLIKKNNESLRLA